MNRTIPAVMLTMTLTGGCTWVKVSDSGRAVSVTSAEQSSGCELVGRITAISRASIAGINRNMDKLANELETIARNEAGSMGGNTVAALAPIQGNEQKFGVYRCDNPEADHDLKQPAL